MAAHSLASWLLGNGELPDETIVRNAQLAAYAYSVLPPEHPARANFRADYVASLGRHHKMKADLQPLLRAWRAQNIDVLLFKGFQLSEFVYPRPGARYHGDVDVLIHPSDFRRAEDVAARLGWRASFGFDWRLERDARAFGLDRLRGGTHIDVHGNILHVTLPWQSVQRRITAEVWAQSRRRFWNGIDIREPCPADMLIVGLILQRCWSSEEWQLKPHDVADFRYIMRRHGLTRDELWARARALHCEKTVAAFMERCDPDAERLDLTPLTPAARGRLHRRAFLERGLLGRPERVVARAMMAPFALVLALRFVPTVLRVRRALREQNDMRLLLDTLSIGPAKRSSPSRELVVAGVRWATRLVGTGEFGLCLVRALATFVALRDRGLAVTFASGIRFDLGIVIGHAWVEYQGRVITDPDSAKVSEAFVENFRYPRRLTTTTVLDPPRVVAKRGRKGAMALAPQTHRD